MHHTRQIVVLLCLTLHVGTISPSKANSDSGLPVLWSASMENGTLSEWATAGCGGEYNNGIANAEASQEQVHSGAWGAKLTITTPGSSPSGARLFRWCEAQQHPALYYRVWLYFPQHHTVQNWWNVFQWKSKVSAQENDPFFILNVGNRHDGTMYFYLYDWQQRRSHSQSVGNIAVGQWTQIEAFYQCSADATGHVTIWQDGILLFDVAHVKTRYTNGDCEWSVNNYSDALIPADAIVYLDDAAISLSRMGGLQLTPIAPDHLRVSDADIEIRTR